MEWVLRHWDAEKEREETIRAKGERILGLHILLFSAIMGAAPLAGAALEGLLARPAASAIFAFFAVLAFVSGIAGAFYGFRQLNVRMRHVLDPTLALRTGKSAEEWQTAVIVEVLSAYKRNTKAIGELAFHVRLSLEWLIMMISSAVVGFLVSSFLKEIEGPGPVALSLPLGLALGTAAAGLAFYALVIHPRPHRT